MAKLFFFFFFFFFFFVIMHLLLDWRESRALDLKLAPMPVNLTDSIQKDSLSLNRTVI